MNGRSFHKGPDESASLLGQLLHDREPRVFDVMDMDCYVHKIARGCHRYFEEKLPGEELSAAQYRNLKYLATALHLAVVYDGIARDSGVFVVFIPVDRVDLVTPDVVFDVKRVRPGLTKFVYEPFARGTWQDLRALFSGEEWSTNPMTGVSNGQWSPQ